ncbi:MAG: tRNA (guanine37-N1)-methyltransferase [Clostridiales bacterium]|jgi:tRNA (guanine37-N1)-methyltransferase|nr:tRNA (guanine37-N1)-methyltransferase [Clostridiales bacterium]
MRFSVLTLFPELIKNVIQTSITGKALEKGLFEFDSIQIRDFAVNDYGKVDDYLFGGGKGMLMMAEPVYQAWQESISGSGIDSNRTLTVYMSPKGKVFDQQTAARFNKSDHLILLCGHYEGIDQRVLDEIVDEDLSIGDFVLTGGEIAACTVIDACARMLPGVLPTADAYLNESHMSGFLEHPQYTRPASWHDINVPDVLMSGHQANIEKWQKLQSYLETMNKRPDMFWNQHLSEQEWLDLIEFIKDASK